MAPPKAADAKKATPKSDAGRKIAPLLPLPDLGALGGSNGHLQQQQHHNHHHPEPDSSNLDQDPADTLQAHVAFLENDDDADPDDQQDFDHLYAVLQNVLKAKQDKKQKKQQALLQELQDSIASEVQAFEATVAKEQKEMQQTAAAAFGGAKKKLTDKFKAIEELNTKYQQDLKAAWDDYSALYTRLDDTTRKTSTQLEKVRSNQKRKFAALQSSLQQRLTEAEQKLAKLSTKKNVGQGMGQMLKQFVAAATD